MLKTYAIKQNNEPFHISGSSLLSLIIWGNRAALAIVFFWFGFLKIIHLSPAEELVRHLYSVTISGFVSAGTFTWMLGLLECTIGILWLIPKVTKIVFILFMLQMATTFLPLFFLRSETWQDSLALTLTGQYIIKNVVLIASACTISLSTYINPKFLQ